MAAQFCIIFYIPKKSKEKEGGNKEKKPIFPPSIALLPFTADDKYREDPHPQNFSFILRPSLLEVRGVVRRVLFFSILLEKQQGAREILSIVKNYMGDGRGDLCMRKKVHCWQGLPAVVEGGGSLPWGRWNLAADEGKKENRDWVSLLVEWVKY
ncbi:hypothetical protein TNIN_140231 [Trichonephila inaurata madagascariensis]|uniref:Uncharacterized protein n=1 Tax=Trichonephila inaurata madagascariensis TaxID=2747483 RepID=A0A8X6Y4W3_9ARAC|nr:hypothetical protein TNIN_140231 [Trichonephila inaurata madagascariensis]